MKPFFLLGLLFLSICSENHVFGACKNPPISITFLATNNAPAAIWNDDPTQVYKDGIIYYGINCDGSHDAAFGFGRNSSRNFWMKFPAPLAGTVIQNSPPAFAGREAFPIQGSINVRNITGYTRLKPGVAATFYTKVVIGLTLQGQNYRLGFYPDDATCPTGAVCVPNLHVGSPPDNLNQPAQTSWAKVIYTPRNLKKPWSITNADTWLVEGEQSGKNRNAMQRATLVYTDNFIHSGQYSFPFKVLITALAPLPKQP
jgi:hypothetical protein